MSSLGKLFSRRPATPRKEARPFTRRLSRYEVRSFRPREGDELTLPEIESQYKPPPVWVEHRGIVICFALLCLALTAYWIKSVRSSDGSRPAAAPARAPAAAAPESVYIEMVPSDKGASSAR